MFEMCACVFQTLGSALQQHFLLFSQRLHSAEVERRSLRLEMASLKRGRKEEREEVVSHTHAHARARAGTLSSALMSCVQVAARRLHSVWAELRQALGREQEAQTLLQQQTNQLHSLQRRASAHAAQQRRSRDAHRRLGQVRPTGAGGRG